MIDKFRQKIANIIYPKQKNSMSLPNQFLKYGNGKKLTADWKQVMMTDQDMYTGYGYATIRKRANAVARMALEFNKTESLNDGLEHPYLKLINSSPEFSNYDFWSVISTYLDLEGVYYLMALRNFNGEKFGDVQQFKLLNPYNVHRVKNISNGEVIGGYIEVKNGYQREIPKEMIIEIKELNPFSSDAFSMTDAAKEAQFGLKTSGDYLRNSMRNNMNTPGIITTDVILSDSDFANFKSRLTDHTKGEPLIANGASAIKWEPMNIDLKNSAVKETKEIDREELFAITGVSKTIMGIEQSGVTRETSKVQRELLAENEIIPRIQLINDALNQDYKNKYKEEYKRTEVSIYIDNPLATDHDSELKVLEIKTAEVELYETLLQAGYPQDKVAKYVRGEITIDQLGEPTRPEPVVDPMEDDNTDDEDKDDSKDDNSKNCSCGHVSNQSEGTGQSGQQEASLRNAIVNIEQNLVATMVNKIEKKTAKNQFEEEFQTENDIISERAKDRFKNELELVLAGFFGIVISLKGGETMRKRMNQYAMGGLFKFDRNIKQYIKSISQKTSESHVNTVVNDILKTARESALAGKGQKEIINDITTKYSKTITETRAKTIARTEANRAFTRAQYEADHQFIKQNKLSGRAYKQWRTRSGNPCEFCLEMERRGAIPFGNSFAGLGESISVEDKTLEIGFETVQAGNLHPNCNCVYELIIRDSNNMRELEALSKELEGI